MDVHVRNVPPQATENHFGSFLKGHFKSLLIRSVHVNKPRDKTFAFLTFLHVDEAELFLRHYGQTKNQTQYNAAQFNVSRYSAIQRSYHQPQPKVTSVNLVFLGQPIYCQKSSKEANPYLLRVLAKEEKDRHTKVTKLTKVDQHIHYKPQVLPAFFAAASVSCGVWSYIRSNLLFEPQVSWELAGTLKFGEHSTILTLDSGLRIDFLHFATLCIAAEEGSTPSFIFSMREAPRFFERIVSDPLAEMMAQLGMQTPNNSPQNRRAGPERHRLPCMDGKHAKVAGSCFVYRVALQPVTVGRDDVAARMQSLRLSKSLPRIIHRRTDVIRPQQTFEQGVKMLEAVLSSNSTSIPFPLAFQILKLALDGYLPPLTVLKMIPDIQDMVRRTPIPICVKSIRKLFNQLSYAGPDSEATEFELEELLQYLKDNEEQCQREDAAVDKDLKGSENIAIIHRVKITPSSIRLCGPEVEANNRVLRKYPNHHEYFIRVQFSDEDGQQVRFSPRVSNQRIFHGRFKNILRNGITIAGREYSFLGSSHSSLRAQSCWFMAPFVFEGSLLYDRIMIQELGNFSAIQSPAKCAARIGQVFSDTRTAVAIDHNLVIEVPDVERNGRTFSDGVGTISVAMMQRIWDALPKAKRIKPNLFQIRYRGAKGMISLDTRLPGDCMLLRPSMIKFDGSTWPDIEICEAAYRPLTMYLNRQFIKILEDLGVEDHFFLNLQAQEVQRLRSITESPINASTFLKRQSIGISLHLPWLINELAYLGLDFRRDGFLRDVLEMTLLVELRLLKHKTRIPVDKGWHLHGIMDETGFLEEGQVYCSATIDGVPMALIKKNLVITRAPALHPGDVQLADGVIPPRGSPLSELTNCIVFSSKGARDLPSQLSGGDLDGDRYYVMWDDNCAPKQTFQPADYSRLPPIDINRAVTKDDMTDFFIQFMETDQLGRIAVLHRVMADQEPTGTLHMDCLKLAEMHSTAVDFSKTGIPVDMSLLPRYNKWRPDFEAPGPHVNIEKQGGLSLEEIDDPDTDDPADEDDDFSKHRYYESSKVLGKLYRAIDEREIFEHIKRRSLNPDISSEATVIDSVWDHVRTKCALFQYSHHLEWARDIRAMYEETMLDIMINHSEHTLHAVSELEAFIGNILGRTGAQSKNQRELSTTMKERFDEHSAFIVNCIVKDGTEWNEESLERSMACLCVSLEKKDVYKRWENLLSFRYLAAGVCLREVERVPGL
ncbi:related to RNA-directed RNA polymerase [Rhynchosporium graminicola]|uniref:RNA-dependent RNA polymerase n=1 Tax=Rhynchosporium graminicola TaxID=2792576 RepID=A0A1E1KA35_9HELO|nr:related to RNA-directed RNA polymerase [Rhynchosporium commune]